MRSALISAQFFQQDTGSWFGAVPFEQDLVVPPLVVPPPLPLVPPLPPLVAPPPLPLVPPLVPLVPPPLVVPPLPPLVVGVPEGDGVLFLRRKYAATPPITITTMTTARRCLLWSSAVVPPASIPFHVRA